MKRPLAARPGARAIALPRACRAAAAAAPLSPPAAGAARPRSRRPAAGRDATRRSRCCAKRSTRPAKRRAEQYQPTSVDTVLGNPTVTLTHEAPKTGKLDDVKKAPTAADIAGLRDGYYLDLEGEALGDTCVYARASRS